MTDIDQAIVEAVLSLRLPEPDNHHDAYHCPYCNTRRDAAETAALAERDAARAERDRAQEHLAYHLRDYVLNGEHTGDLAVDMASWAGRLQVERDAERAKVARLRAAVEGLRRVVVGQHPMPYCERDGRIVVDLLARLRAALADTEDQP